MTYPDYKIAAERHLQTCFELVQILLKMEEKQKKGGLSSKEEKTKTQITENVYYLTGYMLECLYSYAMCKQDSYPQANEVKDLDNGGYKLCFRFNKRSNLSVNYSLQRPKHQMSFSELSFFDDASSGYRIAVSQNIPLIHGNRSLSNIDLQKLFENWSAFERYKFNHDSIPNLHFDIKNIIDLFWEIVEICAKISEYIIHEVTLFRRVIKKRTQYSI